jgi:hypothetical protein
MTAANRRHAAYHEAGHAVMGFETGVARVTRIWLREAEYLGTIAARTCVRTVPVKCKEHGAVLAHLQKVVDVLLGGMAAERIRYGRWFGPGAQGDIDKVVRILRSVSGERRRLVGQLAARFRKAINANRSSVRALLSDPPRWAAVEAIAVALIERGGITGREARRLWATATAGARHVAPEGPVERAGERQ